MAEQLFDDAAQAYGHSHDDDSTKRCLLNRGICVRHLKNYKLSLQLLNAARKLDPMYVKSHFHLARTYEEMGKVDIAYRVADKAYMELRDVALKELADRLYALLNGTATGSPASGGGSSPADGDSPPPNRDDYFHPAPPTDRELPSAAEQASMISRLMHQQQ